MDNVPVDAGLPAGPTHIAVPLARVVADVFHGLPDNDGVLPAGRAVTRRAHLRERAAKLDAFGGLDQLAARWPVVDGAPVPTFATTETHTLEQLDLIEAAIAGAERDVQAPFPEPDPHDPANIVVPNDDLRVTGLVARLEGLPGDLAAAVAATTRDAGVPNLRTGRITEAHLTTLEPVLADAEGERNQRMTQILGALEATASTGISEKAVLAALGVDRPDQIHGEQLTLLDWLADSVLAKFFTERDGDLVVDQPQAVIDLYGGAGALLRAAKTLAAAHGWPKPRSSDHALTSPLLVAALIQTQPPGD